MPQASLHFARYGKAQECLRTLEVATVRLLQGLRVVLASKGLKTGPGVLDGKIKGN